MKQLIRAGHLSIRLSPAIDRLGGTLTEAEAAVERLQLQLIADFPMDCPDPDGPECECDYLRGEINVLNKVRRLLKERRDTPAAEVNAGIDALADQVKTTFPDNPQAQAMIDEKAALLKRALAEDEE